MLTIKQWLRNGILTLLFLSLVAPANSQFFDDLLVGYSGMYINNAIVGGEIKKPVFYRHNFEVGVGKGPASVGLVFQIAQKDEVTVPGIEENGLMLTAGYDLLLGSRFRLQFNGRLALTESNRNQPLYASDTDFGVNFVTFNPNGNYLGNMEKPIYPSAYVGTIVNNYGRVQGILGSGVWWNNFGMYLTGFYAFTGVEFPGAPPSQFEGAVFANLKNSGISLGLTYEYKDFTVWYKQNHAFQNGGDDIAFTVQYRFFFNQRSVR